MLTTDKETLFIGKVATASSIAVTLAFIGLMVTTGIFSFYLITEKPQETEPGQQVIITSLDHTMFMNQGPHGEIISYQIPSKELTFWWDATLKTFCLFIASAGLAVLANQVKKRESLTIPSSP